MGNLEMITGFIVLLNVLMWTGGLAMTNINPDGSFCYNLEGSIIESNIVESGGNLTLNNDIINQLPDSQTSSISTGSTNIFTDIFSNVINWFKSAPGLKYVYGVVSAPYNVLKCLNLPNSFIIGVGTFWYMTTFLVLIAFIWGRQ